MVFDWDDFGVNHTISNTCQSHDCRDKLDQLHHANPAFKCTLFAIPGQMTPELLEWCRANESWIELAVHGFYHSSNYECEKLTYQEFDDLMTGTLLGEEIIGEYFAKIFKAPGWQISDGAYTWLLENGWMIADQGYNDHRRAHQIPAYVNYDGKFVACRWTADPVLSERGLEGYDPRVETEQEAWHGHTWDCCGNGIYETFDHVKSLVESTKEFKFVSEVLT